MSENFENFNSQPPQSGQPVHSPRSIAQIAGALAKAQGEIVQPEKNKTVKVRTKSGETYTFDYADYNAIVEAVRVPLSKHGICFTHLIEGVDSGLLLVTRLIHSSGEFLESIYPLPRTMEPKDLGGAITYGKRYCLSAITGCVADDDADAEPANVTEFKDRKPAPALQQPQPAPGIPRAPSAAQIARLFAIASGNGWTNDQVKIYMETTWKISSTKDLTLDKYEALVDTIQKKSYAQACIGGSPS